MTMSAFTWTTRARPIVELGVGDTRIPTGQAVWDTARWDTSPHTWAGTEPTWHDITCDTNSYNCTYGRQRATDRFGVGAAIVRVDNTTGWADPNVVTDTNVLTVRPGRPIRMGVIHETLGVRWLFRGFVDAVTPVYEPVESDTVDLVCIDALGEVNRAKFAGTAVAPAGETVTDRLDRILTLTSWPATKRDLDPTAVSLIAANVDGQAADLLGQAADSGGGSIFGDYEANIAYRARDWQTFVPGTPVDGEISNTGDAGGPSRVTFGDFNYLWFGDQVTYGSSERNDAVCPVRWERPFNRSDIATRVIVGRKGDDVPRVQIDDIEGQTLYGIEPFTRTDLLTEHDDQLQIIAQRIWNTRHHSTAPRVRSVSLDARTADNALDMMTTVDVYKPSRYRCRLDLQRGVVFDDEYFATAVTHDVTPDAWKLDLNLDVAAPYETLGADVRWDSARWDESIWASVQSSELIGAPT